MMYLQNMLEGKQVPLLWVGLDCCPWAAMVATIGSAVFALKRFREGKILQGLGLSALSLGFGLRVGYEVDELARESGFATPVDRYATKYHVYLTDPLLEPKTPLL